MVDGWKKTTLGNKKHFKILGSGIDYFEGTKDYLSTSSVEADKIVNVEQVITFFNRPSRANMQPIKNSVWFAKMKNTLKVLMANDKIIKNNILSTGFCGIETFDLEPSFLKQFFMTKEFNLTKDSLSSGSTQEGINNNKVLTIEISFPESPFEQSKIAEVLLKIDYTIKQTEKIIEKNTLKKDGLMQDLFTKGIDEKGNIRSEKTHKFKDSTLGRIPDNWIITTIGTSCYVTKLAGYEFTEYIKYIPDGEIIGLRALNIKNERLILDDIQRISKKVSDSLPRSKVNKNDILITYIGAYIGDILRIEEDNKYHLAPNIAKIVAGTRLIPEFLESLLRSQKIQNQFKTLTATTANPSLTMGQIRKVVLAIPSQKDEQEKIVEVVSSITNAINKEKFKLSKLIRFKAGLMQDLLTGEVRVTPLMREAVAQNG